MGADRPKAFVRLNGKSLLVRSLEAIISSGVASTIVVAAPEDFLSQTQSEIESLTHSNVLDLSITAVAGGADRQRSVQIALKHIGDCESVLIHDAARALTPPEVFSRVIAALRSGAEAVVPVLPMTDTVRRMVPGSAADTSTHTDTDAGTDAGAYAERAADREVLRGDLDRTSLRRIQTPQGFTAAILLRAHERYRAEDPGPPAPTDDAGLVERLGVDIVAVDGDEESLKITYPLDLVLGDHLARLRDDEAGGPR